MKQDEFLAEIERRLEENRLIAAKSIFPNFLKPLVTYLGFNTFRSLFVISLLITIGGVVYFFPSMVSLGKMIFFTN